MQKFRVLLVDDEVEIRDCLQLLASQSELEFDQAANGEIGLEMILKTTYDCVVSDIKMPRMNGIEMLKRVRQAGLDVPIVFISAFATEDFAHQVSEYGAVKLLHKLEMLKVRERIQEAILLGHELREIHKKQNIIGEEFIQLLHRTGPGK
jgi:YesN/AraC family two-component response regulator